MFLRRTSACFYLNGLEGGLEASVRSSAGQRPNKVRLERAGSSLLEVKTVGLLVVPAALLLRTDLL